MIIHMGLAAESNSTEPDRSQLSTSEPEVIAETEVSASPGALDGYGSDPATTQKVDLEYARLFDLPKEDVPDIKVWDDVAFAEAKLREHVAELLKDKSLSLDSEEFLNLVDTDKVEVRTESTTIGLTRINGSVCIRATHYPTEDAVLIGPREVLNPKLPASSHFQKYVSNIFTFSGKNSGYKVRGRNIHLIRIAGVNDMDSAKVQAEFLEKPVKWLSWGWYKHYLNAAFSKPNEKTRNAAIFSTLLEMGVLYASNKLSLAYAPDPHPVTLAAGAFAGSYSFVYGLFANGIRKINQFGRSNFIRGLKASAWTLAYSVPFAMLVGQENIVTVIGVSFMANKSADVYWSQVTRFDDQLRTMPGDYLTPTHIGMDRDLKWKGESILKLAFKLKLPSFMSEMNMGSRVNMKNIFLRMPRFALKALSIMEPTVGVTMLLISIPVMSVVARNYAIKKMESGDINAKAADDFIKHELENIWTRAWDALHVANDIRNKEGFMLAWDFYRSFMNTESLDLGIYYASMPDRTRLKLVEFAQEARTYSLEIIANVRDYTKAEIDYMLSQVSFGLADYVDSFVRGAQSVANRMYYFGNGLRGYLLLQGVVHSGLKNTGSRYVEPRYAHEDRVPNHKHPSRCRSLLN